MAYVHSARNIHGVSISVTGICEMDLDLFVLEKELAERHNVPFLGNRRKNNKAAFTLISK